MIWPNCTGLLGEHEDLYHAEQTRQTPGGVLGNRACIMTRVNDKKKR
jgi:hypothetical protein